MKLSNIRPFPLAILLATSVLSGCPTLPKAGPSLRTVSKMPTQPAVQTETEQTAEALPKVAIVDMNDAVSLNLARGTANQSLADLADGRTSNPDSVGMGDVLEITLWESPPAVLFGGAINSLGSGTSQTVRLPEQMVGSNGTISIPFLGNINVRGKTPQQIQAQIVSGLSRKAHQPQALVRVVQNNSANATVIRAGRSVRMPLTAHRERVLDAVAAVGGVESGVQDISLQLTRGNQMRTVALENVTLDPTQNIVLRSGDVLTMQSNPLSFTALGAVGKNQQVNFAAKGMKLSEALGAIGGLLDGRADARGVFVFRYQKLNRLPEAEQMAWRNEGYSDLMDIPVVYRVNLAEPHSMFWLQRFAMNDKDVIYVANAPASEMQKFLHLLFSPVVSGVNSVNNLTN
ncbi:polysaccharide export protein [Kingella negevensis]|uniref:Polysaccharide biosynthesis/export protein n=1 Tax=Kingella negevensis TaxID=1522312 RepID=A0A238T9L5_9NEIS|nr:polysaccharide biosynthesis/export family protein [Kingella negevensis]MDK4679257.1 polysaccharide export protein [Kingella negevensis]MDK4683021.1 polysaccharide export protein [Kingella negevensis]MDK4683786.1 polysaccharide export protein [Kingella negevensis]MDK4691221.1 polysaccharide export protein [Kingella negevensis]MDK4693631.1 polysaccharide export protein [Kingella negevensis]